MYLNHLGGIQTLDAFDLSGQSGLHGWMTRNWGQFLIAIPKEHTCFLPACILCADHFQVPWISHLEGHAGPLMLLSHLSHRSTFHSTPRALQLSLEPGSQVGVVAGLRHSGAHSQSAHLGRCTGICSLAGRSLRFGKWPHRTHSYRLLSLEYWGSGCREERGERKTRTKCLWEAEQVPNSRLFVFQLRQSGFLSISSRKMSSWRPPRARRNLQTCSSFYGWRKMSMRSDTLSQSPVAVVPSDKVNFARTSLDSSTPAA